MKRGTLRVYLGAAPGVGKTFAMLNEGNRRHERDQDVVVGLVETHGRPLTEAQIHDLEVIPRKKIIYRDKQFEELDVEAIIERKPDVALIDEMAHSNVPGMKNAKRWQDIDDIRSAGINVITTLNIQHLESVNDVVEHVTGVAQNETIPDANVRAADQIELVDISPDSLRRRMAHGNIYPAERVDTALANYFRIENLTSLRELALLWVADQVDEALQALRESAGIDDPWGLRERVVVAIDGTPGTDDIIRRAARMAQRAHTDFLAVNVRTDNGLRDEGGIIDELRQLVADLGGQFHQVAASDVAEALVAFARSQNASQLVLGSSHHSKWNRMIHGSVISRTIELSGPIDVHVIARNTTREVEGHQLKVPRSPISRTRRITAWALAIVSLPVLTLLLVSIRDSHSLPTDLLLYLLVVVVISAIGGFYPAIVSAICAFVLVNWFFTPPIHTWTISERDNVIALFVFVAVAIVVSGLVGRAARRSVEAIKANTEAEELARVAATMVHEDPLLPLVTQLRSTFHAKNVTVFERSNDAWQVLASDGVAPRETPDGAAMVESLSADTVVAIDGNELGTEDLRVLHAFFDQLRSALEGRKLRQEARAVNELRATNELRTALLQAVSHDLRTPLAGIKASVSSLRQTDVEWSEEATQEFLATIEEETDRLNRLVGNLLDMSRVQAGVLHAELKPVELDEVVSGALNSLNVKEADVSVKLPIPPVVIEADAAILERAVANIVDNARKWSSTPPRVEAGAFPDRVVLRVIDDGPGIPELERENVFAPFQRVNDRANDAGVGLGLAVARGFLRAMGTDVDVDDTPGGGVTMSIKLDSAE